MPALAAPSPPRLALTALLVAAALLAASLAACSTTGRAGPPPIAYAPPVPAAPQTTGWRERAGSASVLPGSREIAGAPAREGAAATAPDERPGLATSFGERRDSRVEEIAFQRDGRPLAVAALHYDDATGVAALAARAGARLPRPAPIPVAAGLTLSVVDEAGDPLPALFLDGRADGRVFVVGESGRRYALLVRNDTGQRLEVVASVDGRDVLDGRPARLDKRGYLVDPWSTLTIEGFRTSLEDVAAFRFGAVGESYAARTGDATDVGVIGLAFFAERGAVTAREAERRDEEAARRLRARPFDDRFTAPPM